MFGYSKTVIFENVRFSRNLDLDFVSKIFVSKIFTRSRIDEIKFSALGGRDILV